MERKIVTAALLCGMAWAWVNVCRKGLKYFYVLSIFTSVYNACIIDFNVVLHRMKMHQTVTFPWKIRNFPWMGHSLPDRPSKHSTSRSLLRNDIVAVRSVIIQFYMQCTVTG